MIRPALPLFALLAFAAPVAAKESLGIFSDWGAFRDASVPRCYAIAEAQASERARDFAPYATVASWPARRISGQVHLRLSRSLHAGSAVTLRVGGRNFALSAGKADAWAKDRAMDAAILDALRRAETMTVYATDARGRRFSDSYRLEGAATAIDAVRVACVRR